MRGAASEHRKAGHIPGPRTGGAPSARSLGPWSLAGLVLLLCAVLSAVARGAAESYAVFLLPLSESFGWDRAAASSVYAVLMLSLGLSSPIVGRIFDRWGPGPLYALGLGSLGVGMIAASRADGLWQFYLFIGVLGGFGACAIGMVPNAALLSRWYHGRLTTAIAVVSAAAGAGVLLLSPLTQFAIDRLGWRGGYLALGVGIMVLLSALALLPWRSIAGGRSAGPQSHGAAVGAVLPALTLSQALRTRAFWALFMIHFLTANGMFAINPQIVAFLVEMGFPPLTAASAFGFAGIAATAGLLTFGWLADRVGRLLSVTISYAMTLGGFALLGLMEHYPSGWLLVLFIVVYGPSFGSRGPIISAMTAGIFGRGRDLGVILGAVSLGMGTGAASGATLGGLLHDWSGGYGAVVAFACLTVVIPAMLFWLLPELRRQ